MEVMEQIFGRMDFTDRTVQLVMGGLVLAILIFCLLFVLLLHKLKLIIPKSKLHDDAFIYTAVSRTRLLHRICQIVFGVSAATILLFFILSASGVVEDIFTHALFLICLCLTFLFLPAIFPGGRRRYKPHEQLQHAVERNRMAQYASEHGPHRGKRMVIWGIIIAFFLFAALAALPGALYRGFGKFGVVWHLGIAILGMAVCGAGLRQFLRAAKRASGLEKIKACGWSAGVAVLFGLFIWFIIPAVQDLPAAPVTQQVEVVSFTPRYLKVQSVETGEIISMRIGRLERQFTLKELWNTWKDSRTFYGDTSMRLMNPDLVDDKTVTCTVTYYPNTRYRVSVDDIAMEP